MKEIASDSIKEVSKTYEKTYENLTKIPQTENDLKILREVLVSYQFELKKSEEKLKLIEKILKILEDFLFKFDENEYKFYYSLKFFSLDIIMSAEKAKIVEKNQELKFVNKLEQDKMEFKKNLEPFFKTFEEIKEFHDYDKLKSYSKRVNDFSEKIEKNLEIIISLNQRELLFSQKKSSNIELENLNKVNFLNIF